MKIADVAVYRYDLPLKRPLLVKGGIVQVRSGLVLRVRADDGGVAFGDAAPLPGFSRETLGEAAAQAVGLTRLLRDRALPPEVGLITDRFERWFVTRDLVPSVKFALQAAVFRLLARARLLPGFPLAADDSRPSVPVNALLAGDTDAIAARARDARAQGYGTFKLKVGGDIAEDIERVRLVREIIGLEARLRLDANRAWEEADAEAFARGVRDCAVEYIEEPLADPRRMIEFSARSGLPVALDETIAERGGEALEQWRGARALVLKPTLLGGFEITMWLARKAVNLGMTPVISSSFESGLGIAALGRLAAYTQSDDVAAGLDTLSWFAADVLDGPLPITDGALDLAGAQVLADRVPVERLQELRRG